MFDRSTLLFGAVVLWICSYLTPGLDPQVVGGLVLMWLGLSLKD